MKPMMKIGVLGACLVLGACATTSTIRMATVVGTWYGVSKQPQMSPHPIHWVVDRSADGTFSVAFHEQQPCGLSQLPTESGRWAMSNGYYTAVTTRIGDEATDTSNAFFQDVYEILDVSRDRIRYRSLKYGIEFDATRVSPGYLPPIAICPGGNV